MVSKRSMTGETPLKSESNASVDAIVTLSWHTSHGVSLHFAMPMQASNARDSVQLWSVPKNQCNVCKKFFADIVFPKLISGTPACQP
jgi:hypothetical protein